MPLLLSPNPNPNLFGRRSPPSLPAAPSSDELPRSFAVPSAVSPLNPTSRDGFNRPRRPNPLRRRSSSNPPSPASPCFTDPSSSIRVSSRCSGTLLPARLCLVPAHCRAPLSAAARARRRASSGDIWRAAPPISGRPHRPEANARLGASSLAPNRRSRAPQEHTAIADVSL